LEGNFAEAQAKAVTADEDKTKREADVASSEDSLTSATDAFSLCDDKATASDRDVDVAERELAAAQSAQEKAEAETRKVQVVLQAFEAILAQDGTYMALKTELKPKQKVVATFLNQFKKKVVRGLFRGDVDHDTERCSHEGAAQQIGFRW